MTKNYYQTTGISNIDDKEYGLNILNGYISYGYLTFENIETAKKCEKDIQSLIDIVHALQEKYNITINLSFE